MIKDVGDCSYSCMNSAEALEEIDCMCISLSINRPQAAIADPSRLVINDIYPSYISADSFLNSANFNLEKAGGN